MADPSNLNDIIQRILKGNQTDADVEVLRQWFNKGGIQDIQVGKSNVNIGQYRFIHSLLQEHFVNASFKTDLEQ